jgi:GTP-binding protein EngB required for normal cell division
MLEFLSEQELSPVIVLSKCDRLGRNDVNKSIAHTQKVFFGQQILPVSSSK